MPVPPLSFLMIGEAEEGQERRCVLGEPAVEMQVFRGLFSSLADRVSLGLRGTVRDWTCWPARVCHLEMMDSKKRKKENTWW